MTSNATAVDDENALHWAVVQNDLAAARLLIEAGINIDQHGDLGHTPLHDACVFGHRDMVLLLIESGADIHARTEGDTPFEPARRGGHTESCDLLRPLMAKAPQGDPHFWTKVKIVCCGGRSHASKASEVRSSIQPDAVSHHSRPGRFDDHAIIRPVLETT